MSNKSISQILIEKTFKELGFDSQGRPISSHKSPVSSRNTTPHAPFHISQLNKTLRQAASVTGYKASASWQTANLLRDLLTLWFESLPPVKYQNLPLFSRTKAQILDAARSTIANIEEGWARPSTKEYLDFLGFSQASLAEVRGDVERLRADEIMEARPGTTLNSLGIPTPSQHRPYPPAISRKDPSTYGSIRERLREFTGQPENQYKLTFEIFIELINKTNYLINKTVTSLQQKIISNQQKTLNDNLKSNWHKHW